MNRATQNVIERLETLSAQAPDSLRAELSSIVDDLRTPNDHGDQTLPVDTHGSDEDKTQQQIRLYLKEAGDYARMLIDASLDAIISVDMLLRIVEFNPAAERAFGYEKAEVIGKSIETLYAEPAEGWRVRIKTHDKGFSGEVRNRRKNGEVFTSLVRSVKICNPDGEVIGVMGISRDITQQRTLEDQNKQYLLALSLSNRELEQARAAAEEANQAKSRFLANMSHEIRTPLTAVIGFTGILRDTCENQPQAAPAIEVIRRNSEHLLAMLDDLLDYSKLEAGRLKIERVPCELSAIVADVIALFAPAAEQSGIKLKWTSAGDVPVEIYTDPTRLRQILMNLVSNAVKFTSQGCVEVRIGLSANSIDGLRLVKIEVIDAGIGMTPDQVAGLFCPFMQADASTSRKFGGTGLGLAISRRLARLLGGDIAVQSHAGSGSTFTITLPCSAEAMTTTPSVSRHPVTQTKPLAGLRILAVDDCPDNQMLVDHYLEKYGAQATIATSGRDAIERASTLPKDERFHAILMDMQMPEMDGYEATRLFRERGWSGPIIALTADDIPQIKDRCLNAGCDTLAAKPIDWPRLVNTIRELALRRETGRAQTPPRLQAAGPRGRAYVGH